MKLKAQCRVAVQLEFELPFDNSKPVINYIYDAEKESKRRLDMVFRQSTDNGHEIMLIGVPIVDVAAFTHEIHQ